MAGFIGWFNALSGLAKAGVVSTAIIVPTAVTVPLVNAPSLEPTQQSSQTEPVREEKTETTIEAVPCAKESYNDAALAKGQTQITQACVNGEKTNTFKVVFIDGKETERSKTGEAVTTAPVTERTAIGTKVQQPVQQAPKCDSNYSGCVPIVSYDLDCPDIGFRVIVYGSDKHGFDGDGDGVGCESY